MSDKLIEYFDQHKNWDVLILCEDYSVANRKITDIMYHGKVHISFSNQMTGSCSISIIFPEGNRPKPRRCLLHIQDDHLELLIDQIINVLELFDG